MEMDQVRPGQGGDENDAARNENPVAAWRTRHE
jgi:hypothetical protein